MSALLRFTGQQFVLRRTQACPCCNQDNIETEGASIFVRQTRMIARREYQFER